MSDTHTMPDALQTAMGAFLATLKAERQLPQRLIELVRLRIAFHNQCRPCMSIRYNEAVADGLTEGLVCSLEKPAEASDMTPAERECVLFADRFASDHLSIDAAQLARLAEHLAPDEVRELAMHCAFFTGFGRMGAVFDTGDALPVGDRRSDGARLTPWGIEPAIV
ncbi:carboxymuconolactone decarboxylase family protein [Sphingomonas jatrophae]|uniref:Alkylhydroperoxidase AhpD family core domain-containing protein n=1 Tax=Sphingomonas jatrophae TaxID=1166337 RepID=A0A1I6KEE1_9SPHN|nr:carboxymuconolactone decarboxylase family protein [Sphingomonas jatrophae]SFR89635.1 alkylhydroperoxidase AhpD family core domain-containing protein [Sphingomonas jatrophae]